MLLEEADRDESYWAASLEPVLGSGPRGWGCPGLGSVEWGPIKLGSSIL